MQFENRIMRRIFPTKREKVIGLWYEQNYIAHQKFHNIYCSQNIARKIKPRRTKRAKRLSYMGDMINATKISVGKPEGETTW
jgi:hypothetical protein